MERENKKMCWDEVWCGGDGRCFLSRIVIANECEHVFNFK